MREHLCFHLPSPDIIQCIVKPVWMVSPQNICVISYRYVSAAQELVMHARGVSKSGSWRTSEDKMASGDDISVFVIPLHCYQTMLSQSSSTESTNEHS